MTVPKGKKPYVGWIRGRFVDIPITQEILEDAGVQSAEDLPVPGRISGWVDPIAPDPVEAVAGADGSHVPLGILSPRQLHRMRISSWIRERFRFLGWISRLLRR